LGNCKNVIEERESPTTKQKRTRFMPGAVRGTTDIFNQRILSSNVRTVGVIPIKLAYKPGEIPAKVLAFFTTPSGGILALIHPTECMDHRDNSCLTESYKLSYKKTKNKAEQCHCKDDGTFGEPKMVLFPALELVDVDAIVDAAYVIEEYPGVRESIVREDSGFANRVLLVKPHKN
jgi:hypothetical protein